MPRREEATGGTLHLTRTSLTWPVTPTAHQDHASCLPDVRVGKNAFLRVSIDQERNNKSLTFQDVKQCTYVYVKAPTD